MTTFLAVALAGGAGAVARVLVDRAVRARTPGTFPWGTLVVNVTGSFVLGVLTGLAWHHGLGGRLGAVLGTGLCGGFTTWSTASWESVRLLELGLSAQAAGKAVGGLCVALGAAAVGMVVGMVLATR